MQELDARSGSRSLEFRASGSYPGPDLLHNSNVLHNSDVLHNSTTEGSTAPPTGGLVSWSCVWDT